MNNEYRSYLNRLRFPKKLFETLQAQYLLNFRIVILFIIAILSIGLVSFLNLPRRLNPEVKIPIVVVSTLIPGSSPKDVESLITVPLEDKLKGVQGLDTITSVSRDSVSIITMQFFSTVDIEKAKDDVQSSVDAVADLPTEAETPNVVTVDFEDTPVWTFMLTGKQTDTASLMRISNRLKDVMEDIPSVDRVQLAGYAQEEVQVLFSPEKIQEYGINPISLSQLIQKAAAAYPAGITKNDRYTFSLTLNAQVAQTIESLRHLRITTHNQTVQLGDIATVVERTKPDLVSSYYATAQDSAERAVRFSVYKTSSSNIDSTARTVEERVRDELKPHEESIRLVTVSNTANDIEEQFSDLLREFRSTIILVFICLLVFLGLRQAIISSFTVPLTFLSAFAFMWVFGLSMNFLTMFAFLIALGLLIDDTIVIVSATTTYYQSGKFTPAQTGLLVWRDFIVPIWSTTITTIWSFVPLLLATGIIGEFIKSIPIVVTVTMISSTTIAVLITLPLMLVLLKPQVPRRVVIALQVVCFALLVFGLGFLLPKNIVTVFTIVSFVLAVASIYFLRAALVKPIQAWYRKKTKIQKVTHRVLDASDKGLINLNALGERYRRIMLSILQSKRARVFVVVGIVIYSIASYLLIPLGFIKNEFFPKTDYELIYVNLDLPAGTTTNAVLSESKKLFDDLRKTSETEFTTLDLGNTIDVNTGGYGDQKSSALFTIRLPKKEQRSKESFEIAEQLRNEYKQYTAGTLSVVEVSGGPPVGADIQMSLLGEDLHKLDGYADKLISYLEKQPGVTNISKSLKPGTSQLVFVPDEDRLASYGLTNDSVGLWMRLFASGFTLDTLRFENETQKEDIVFRFSSSLPSPDDIGRIMIPTSSSESVPLLALGSIKTQANPTSITREEGLRTVSVSASVKAGYVIPEINAGLETYADSLNMPSPYHWKTGGANEENQRSVISILQAMGVAFILILVTMVLQFSSFRQALIVLLVIPLAVSSVFFIFAITRTPLSFPALIGVLSLFGIVVTNSMFIVDKINLNLKEGMNFNDAIADAGASRLEPIVLTKLTTIFGLLPITLADPFWRGLGGAIIAGVSVSSIIMLFFIPVVYYAWMKPEGPLRKSEKKAILY
ncbi:MAG: efflux RND transporter permease subunit [Candidatus Roizmanbacteria bacterium]|nr:efflux RND transporter permease subunit [Candidatus Roizmanbacteria bacterium]